MSDIITKIKKQRTFAMIKPDGVMRGLIIAKVLCFLILVIISDINKNLISY